MPNRVVMVVEDDDILAEGLKEALEDEGYTALIAPDGESALDLFRPELVDLVILDIMLPGVDGFYVCEELRKGAYKVPILFLSAKNTDDDRIRGIDAGGDDYLPKPFNLEELLARVKAILRRQEWLASPKDDIEGLVRIGRATVDFKSYRLTFGKEQVELSVKECMMLKLLYLRRGQVVPREKIINAVWGAGIKPTTRTVDNFIVRLRRWIEPDPDEPRYIRTVRGTGYQLVQ